MIDFFSLKFDSSVGKRKVKRKFKIFGYNLQSVQYIINPLNHILPT